MFKIMSQPIDLPLESQTIRGCGASLAGLIDEGRAGACIDFRTTPQTGCRVTDFAAGFAGGAASPWRFF
jgi:hypothetical protein